MRNTFPWYLAITVLAILGGVLAWAIACWVERRRRG